MSHETRRRVLLAVVMLIVVAFVLASVGCTSTTDPSGADASESDGDRLEANLYPAAMAEICATTDARLSELPPPEESRRAEWADAVSRALLDESERFDAMVVTNSLDDDHRAFTANTAQQSASWSDLAEALRTGDDDGLGAASDEIATLTLGRNDLAGEMGLDGCRERQIGG